MFIIRVSFSETAEVEMQFLYVVASHVCFIFYLFNDFYIIKWIHLITACPQLLYLPASQIAEVYFGWISTGPWRKSLTAVVVNHLLRERKKLHNQLLISLALCFLFWLNLPKYWYRIIARKRYQMGKNVPDLAMGWRKLQSSEKGRMQEERWSHLAVCVCRCMAAEKEIFKKADVVCSFRHCLDENLIQKRPKMHEASHCQTWAQN